MTDMLLTLEKLIMIDRGNERQRAPLRGLMECAGLKPLVDEKGAKGFDVTTASIITGEVFKEALTADHVLLPFTIDAKSDLGKLQTEMLLARASTAISEHDYVYFGPKPVAEPGPEATP